MMLKEYSIDVLNVTPEYITRTIKATRYDIANNRLNFYRETDAVASYPVEMVNIVDVKNLEEEE